MEHLPSKYRDFFSIYESQKWSLKPHDRAYFMALDAEWYESGGQNVVISYQIATASNTSANNIIRYVAPDERLTLAEIVELGIRSVNGGRIPPNKPKKCPIVILVAHHVTAEWSVLADRKEPYITRSLTAIRKSPVTGTSLISLDVEGSPVHVRIFDTRIVAPIDYQSLAKLSTLLGSDNDLKISIEHYYKKRMNLYQRKHPDKYEEYALQDSLVTLKLFFLLQKYLIELAYGKDSLITTVSVKHGTVTVGMEGATITGNDTNKVVIAGTVDQINASLHQLVYRAEAHATEDFIAIETVDQGDTGSESPRTWFKVIHVVDEHMRKAKTDQGFHRSRKLGIKKKKIFRTLASAAVAGYTQKYPNLKAYRNVLESYHFSDPYKLVKRAYHGGRNESYLVGHSEDHENTRNRVWVDIDFVGCYPTAMALCPQIQCGVDLSGKPLDKDDLKDLIKNQSVPIDYRPLVYRLDDKTDEELKEAKIPVGAYRAAKAALDKLPTLTTRQERNRAIQEFNQVLGAIAKPSEKGLTRTQARKIREMAQVADNTLIDKWYRSWTTAKRNGDTRPERYIIPGFAHVRFDFQGKTEYPCLPVIHYRYGLIYPQKGEATVTAPEIMLALDAGAEIEALSSLELPMVMDKSMPRKVRIPRRLFFHHLAWLTKKRMEQKKIATDESAPEEDRQKAKVMERLLKEFLNSFYGKTAQAIRHRKAYSPATGEMRSLFPSSISEPCAAALTTGLPRAALSAVLLAVEKYNRQQKNPDKEIIIVSATTDGLLLGLPRPAGFSLTDEDGYYKFTDKGLEFRDDRSDVLPILERCDCGKLMTLIEEYLPIRQMKNSRRELTDGKKDTFLEVKHMADEVLGVKTRGQIGWVRYRDENTGNERKIVTIQAKFGIKPPLSDIIMEKSELEGTEAKENEYGKIYERGGSDRATWEGDWIHEQVQRVREEEEIFDYDFYGLTGFNEMMKREDHLDLIQKIGKKRFNADFDWKRKLVTREDGKISPITVPHQDVTEMLAHRNKMERERRRGRNAKPDKVLHLVRIQGGKIRNRGGDQAMVVRAFLRGILHNHIPGAKLGKSFAKAAERLNRVWRDLGCTMQDSLVKENGKTVRKPSTKTAWTRDDFKNAKKIKEHEEGLILPTPKLEKLVEELAREFGVSPEKAKSEIFALGDPEEVSKALAVQVAQAVLQAHTMGLEPYRTLHRQNRLPDGEQLIRALHPHMTEDLLRVCGINIFQPNTRPPTDRPKLVRIFRRLGMLTEDAEGCARVIAQPAPRSTKPRRNPAVTKCMETFAQAVLQHDIAQQRITKSELLSRLRVYGLTQRRLNTLSKGKFVPRVLTNTPSNRQQINKMAKSLGLDPTAIADAILDR